MDATALLACTSAVLTGSTVKQVLGHVGVAPESCSFATGFTSALLLPAGLSTVILLAGKDSSISVQLVTAALKAAAPGAAVVVLEPASTGTCQRNAMLSGVLSLSTTSATVDGTEYTVVQGKKPSFKMGAKESINVSSVSSKPTWTLDVSADDDLINEDDLLTEEDRQPVVPPQADCSTSKKACANCTCGRAEAEAAGVKLQLTPEMLENPQSACGSCGLGDAFRCATCPYRGLPSFQPGKKIQVPNDFLAADV